jgi:cytochrome b561
MSKKYTNLFASLHWVHAAMIAAVLIGGLVSLPHLPELAKDIAPFRNHLIMGFAVTLVTFIRIYLVRKQPELEPLKVGAMRQSIITWNHRLIYITLVLVGLSGMATAQLSNMGQVLLFGQDPSVYTGVGGIAPTLGMVHTYGAYLLAALILMHVAGTLSYMVKSGDNVLKRVGFTQG